MKTPQKTTTTAEQTEPITKVVFRKFKEGDILALFPYEHEGRGTVSSYQHIGQHSSADYYHCIHATKPATPEEYAPLLAELTGIGYNLKVAKRR